MQEQINRGEDVVSRLIKVCHQDHATAERLFNDVIAHHQLHVELADGAVDLNEEECAEFVARYSAEVEPTIWESKRRKM